MNVLKWLDDKITYLKNHGIQFENGVAKLTENMLYNGIPKNVEPYDYRNEVPVEKRKCTVLLNFMKDVRLLPRIEKIDEDIIRMREYAAVGGFDISPSILMLRDRQKLSILINSVYNCYLGVNKIKILANGRCGDFGTINTLTMYPKGCNMIVSNHGCKIYGFKYYGLYQTLYIIDLIRPKMLFSYGNVSKKDYRIISKKYNGKLIVYPEHRKKTQYKKSVYTIGTSINTVNNKTDKQCYLNTILQENEIEIKPLIFDLCFPIF